MSKTMNQVIAELNHLKAADPVHYAVEAYSAYFRGHVEPNYPVPVIRLEVDICQTWDKTICIFDLDKNDIVYGVYEGDFN